MLVLIWAAAARADDIAYPSDTLPNGAGGQLCLDEARGREATVLVSYSVECPICGEYMETINEIAKAYQRRGINTIGIDPNAGETLQAIAAHVREKKLVFPIVKDEGAKVSRRLRFQVTPEVCVFDAKGQAVYRGRIDDRYRAGAFSGGARKSGDLERVLDAILAGESVESTRTRAVGCPIQLSASP